MKKLLIGGSPCTKWSIAQKNREVTAEGEGWELFKNYLFAKEKFQPDYFLYENNNSAAPAVKEQISKELGAPLQHINSALVSAQNRMRFYAHNIPNVSMPEDKGLYLRDIVQHESEKEEFECSDKLNNRTKGFLAVEMARKSLKSLDQKSNCLTTGQRITNIGATTLKYPNGKFYIPTPIECERLQTMPDNYTAGISNTQRYKCLGNGWTAEIIIHILSHMNIPLDEELLVLSMYDGIATGRYCLDKLGYKNVRYYAYEVDKNAIKVAMKNYPDVIQCGDAFQVRSEYWRANIMHPEGRMRL